LSLRRAKLGSRRGKQSHGLDNLRQLPFSAPVLLPSLLSHDRVLIL
jgi:hypothetical protein